MSQDRYNNMSDFIPAPPGFEIEGHKVIGFGRVHKGQLFWDDDRVAWWPYEIEDPSSNRYFILEPISIRAANHTCTVSVKDIYGKLPDIPSGFIDVGLSMTQPKDATHYMTVDCTVRPALACKLTAPRLWLKVVE